MKEHGILFSSAMVKALLAGTKTQTRRTVKAQSAECADVWADNGDGTWSSGWRGDGGNLATLETVRAPHGPVGRRLYAKETYGLRSHTDVTSWFRGSIKGWKDAEPWAVDYRADWGSNQEDCFWRPSVHMPRWASRITLEVTRVRVERVGDITPADALAEGFADHAREPPDEDPREVGYQEHVPGAFARERFADLWDEINGAGSFAASPWVWVYDFRRVA